MARQFNGRSWFGINPPVGIPSVIFSDVYALNATNANQVLSFGDNTPLTAAAPLGLANLLGGVVQALIIFKSLNGIIQVTGDATTNNLSVNQVPGGSGTISPRVSLSILKGCFTSTMTVTAWLPWTATAQTLLVSRGKVSSSPSSIPLHLPESRLVVTAPSSE